MSTKDPTPDADPDDPGAEPEVSEADDEDHAADDGDRPGRLPPGPDDLPIVNLPPPSSELIDPTPPEPDEPDEPWGDPEPEPHDGGAEDPEATAADGPFADEVEPAEAAAADRDERWADLGDPDEWGGDDDALDAGPDGDRGVAEAPVRLPPSDRRVSRLTVAAVLVAVLAAGLALAKAQQVGDLVTQRDDRRSIERVAGAFGSAYLSYDFARAEATGRAVQALTTTDFAKAYAAQSAPGIQELFSSRQTTTKATTTEVFVGSVTAKEARALVVVDITATSPTDGEQRLDDVSFVLDLDRTSGGWRVAKVERAPQPGTPQG